MSNGLLARARSFAGRLARAAGLRRAAGSPDGPVLRGYINANEVIRGAAAAGTDVDTYIEAHFGWKGFNRQAEDAAERLVAAGALSSSTRRVLEIGSGSGRHLKAIKRRFPDVALTAYEADPAWRAFLRGQYGAETPEVQGELLAGTESGSVDLVISEVTLVYLPFLSVVSYWNESARVLRPGGFLHFNVFTEQSFTPEKLAYWMSTTHRYPAIMPRDFLVKLLGDRGFSLVMEDNEADPETTYFFFRRT
jgi:SAM-dependent methyltransferase